MEPKILPRDQHCISRRDLSPAALKVLYRLHERGYKAYLAGGCVRDLMLGRHPKDFDVVTDATPREVKRCFSHCRLIGRRFRLAHVIFGEEVIEVATFRANSSNDEVVEEGDAEEADRSRDREENQVNESTGVVERDNVFGTPEEDAFRRDFTVNALFYSIADFSIIDYVGGLADLEKRVVHAIGDPDVRYQEDPVRMIRALRFACTLGLEIEENTYDAILRQREQLAHASHARMYEEILKFFYSGAMESVFEQWCETGLLDVMFPGFAPWLREEASEAQVEWIRTGLRQMDKWKQHGVKASQELLYTLLLAPYLWAREQAVAVDQPDLPAIERLAEALTQVQRELAQRILIPKRVLFRMMDLLKAQERFRDRRSAERIQRFVRRPYFRDALALFKLDLLARQENQAELLAAWTQDLRKAGPVRSEAPDRPRRSRPRRRRR